MSGTSLDGIDVAIVDFAGGVEHRELVASYGVAYPRAVREALLGVSNTATHTAEISRLNFVLGELYAEAVIEACEKNDIALHSVELIGCHGQTIFHEGSPVEYLGRKVASTLQIGEAAVIAERTQIPVISNFRERDMAAGGQGAPLVPYVDYLLFRHEEHPRVALNIGGIANLTWIPAAAKPEDLVAFDTGPGNMVIDALVVRMTDGEYDFDQEGEIARGGSINFELLDKLLRDPYYEAAPPKSAGREQYGAAFVQSLVSTGTSLQDLIATATELTVRSIEAGVAKFQAAQLIISGGGAHNRFMRQRLARVLDPIEVTISSEHGVDVDSKEAIAFAVLAYESYHRKTANLPSATGARRAVILGKLTP